MTEVLEVALAPLQKFSFATTPEWRSVCTRHHNMLLEGPEDVTSRLLLSLKPHLRTPVVWTGSEARFEPPALSCAALVLENVAALSRTEQTGLLRWLDDPGDGRQVISTTVNPLFPLVANGVFDEALYYRLNVILLCVNSSGARSS